MPAARSVAASKLPTRATPPASRARTWKAARTCAPELLPPLPARRPHGPADRHLNQPPRIPPGTSLASSLDTDPPPTGTTAPECAPLLATALERLGRASNEPLLNDGRLQVTVVKGGQRQFPRST